MLITFLVVIAPFLMLVPPLQRNKFYFVFCVNDGVSLCDRAFFVQSANVFA